MSKIINNMQGICMRLITDYGYALRSTMATEACSKRPRGWIMDGLMTDGIRNIQQAAKLVVANGRMIQPGPMDTMDVAQQLGDEAVKEADKQLEQPKPKYTKEQTAIYHLQKEQKALKAGIDELLLRIPKE